MPADFPLGIQLYSRFLLSAPVQAQQKGAIAPCSSMSEESPVESPEHQDNANIHCQPFPESVSEEQEIYTDYDGCHRHPVKHDRYLSAHFSLSLPRCSGNPSPRLPLTGFLLVST
jgi:hypothetical protein